MIEKLPTYIQDEWREACRERDELFQALSHAFMEEGHKRVEDMAKIVADNVRNVAIRYLMAKEIVNRAALALPPEPVVIDGVRLVPVGELDPKQTVKLGPDQLRAIFNEFDRRKDET